MLANRISYSMGLTGPSYLLDTACSSSMYALDCAFSAIRNGECDSALVGGSNLILHPYVSLQFARLGVLAPDGYCRPFDINATGYTRSEAVCVIFLQKAKDAKRIYSTVLYSKVNCDGKIGFFLNCLFYSENCEKKIEKFQLDFNWSRKTKNAF